MRWIFISLLAFNLLAFLWAMVSGSSENLVPEQKAQAPNPYRDYPKLRLLTEIQSGNVVREGARDYSPDVDMRESEVAGTFCELVGPFAENAMAENFVERLRAIDISSAVHDVDLPVGPGYWVYLVPEASRREALRLLNELQSKGVDSYIIPKGELENGISLGMFSRKSSAEARIEELTALGLRPQIDEIERTYREIWVMLRPGEELKMNDFSWQRVMEGLKEVERRQNYCLDVASQQNFH